MPKLTLSFNLPEEQPELNAALNGSKYLSLLIDFDNYLRSRIKYEENCSQQEIDLLTEVRSDFYEMMNERGIDIHNE